jgi:hypothetical protein
LPSSFFFVTSAELARQMTNCDVELFFDDPDAEESEP